MNLGVEVQGLGIRLGRNEVLRGLDLQVQRGEFLVLLGPSGCGKSTLLHGIAGLVEVQQGTVRINGQDVTDAEPSERGIGMVFQSYALYPNMTVEGNLSFGLRLAGTPRAEVAQRVAQAAQMLQLQPLLQRKPAQLSGGQRQRVAIGRALVRQAEVFLLDEPLSNLDAQLRAELRRELKLLHQRLRSTMIYVTHDQVEAMTLATRIVVMRAGQVQQVGTPAEVYARPANRFVAGFLGSPGMNFVRGRLQAAAGGGLCFEAPQCLLPLPGRAFAAAAAPGQEVTLGLRPEHIRLQPPQSPGTHPAWVQLAEPMGNQQVLWLEAGSGAHNLSLAALLPGDTALPVGQAVAFSIDAERVSLFDAHTEQAL